MATGRGLVLDDLIVGVPFAIVNFIVLAVASSHSQPTYSFGITSSATTAYEAVPLRVALVFLETAAAFAYAVWLIGRRRQTIGMQAVGITAIDPSGRALTPRQVRMRAFYRILFVSLWADLLNAVVLLDHRSRPGLVGLASLVPFVLDLVVYLWPLGNDRNQTLIDRAAGSVVVRGNRLGIAASHPPSS